jgi:hypothetical protein
MKEKDAEVPVEIRDVDWEEDRGGFGWFAELRDSS